MKKIIVSNVLLLFVLGFSLSCKKDAAKTRTDLLTSPVWVLSGWTTDPAVDINGDGILETDYYATFTDCQKNMSIKFKTDGTTTATDACTSAMANSTWYFSKDETTLYMTDQANTILNLTDSELKFTRIYITGGITYTHTFTYKAK
jgi:hypothetical protein